ncbi:hypothetical protein E2562_009019 [Oryza meyeriana var. granulata]|uniref:DUF4408 domain-containing protein n=1 Tax=Oryza meyeriana var. granulata TaxID=110450 RepID=A0A6G1CZW1_9ORYZ|nr:hypothetical protein E2562_009019 [Oryza meyeriana var. granulata]
MGYARTVKAATAAAAAVLVAFGVRLVAPAAAGFVADELPRAQAAAATWLTPPYLYLVINAIILSIAASSRFQPNRPQAPASAAAADDASSVRPAPVPVPVPVVVPVPAVTMAMEVPVVPVPEVLAPEAIPVEVTVPEVEEAEENFTISRSTWTPRRRSTVAEVENEASPFADLTNSREKPLVSARFGRKPAKASPEGSKALGVSRPRKEQTLESTWKAITEGRAPPLARHLKKSDTWETRPGRRPSGGGGDEDAPPPATTMRKAETFNEAAGGRKVRREPSLGQDELNRRVEAFINKFNMEMRLQRQESLKHYSEMISRGSHY